MDPFTAWLLLRSLETLPVRTERACENAPTVARFLRDHPKVAGVTYLGFLARRLARARPDAARRAAPARPSPST